MNQPDRHALVQAPVAPLDEDGVVAANVGTGLSVLASLVLWWKLDWLSARSEVWWLWVALTATGAGILFSSYTRYRKRRRLSPAGRASVEQ